MGAQSTQRRRSCDLLALFDDDGKIYVVHGARDIRLARPQRASGFALIATSTPKKPFFGFSTNGTTFQELGNELRMVFQLKSFQGVRYALFHYNTTRAPGGCADFDQFTVDELRSGGLTKPIPMGGVITICSLGDGSVLAVKNATLIRVPAGDPSASSPIARFRGVEPEAGPDRAATSIRRRLHFCSGLGRYG